MHPFASSSAPGSPSYALLAAEPVRAVLEFAGHQFFDSDTMPRGDSHPVVIFPGLGTNERLTRPLHTLCRRLGYEPVDWGQGFNVGPQGDDVSGWLDTLAESVAALVAGHDAPASLVGWSLGGIYAREVAKRVPADRVRQVITIGTPVAGSPEQTNAVLVYRLLNGSTPPSDDALLQALRQPPPVPTTSIYSRSDGVVAWHACLDPTPSRHVENVEAEGSHCGMCWNPAVLRIVADRLAQPVGGWRRYRATS